jgi:hypothetical protein
MRQEGLVVQGSYKHEHGDNDSHIKKRLLFIPSVDQMDEKGAEKAHTNSTSQIQSVTGFLFSLVGLA